MHAFEPIPDALFLSRLSLNLRHRQVRDDLANSQALHRRVLDAVPQTNRDGNNLLYRVDPLGESLLNGAVLLVQSQVEPDWSRLPEGYLVASGDYGLELESDGDVPVKDISASYGGIQAGNLFRFRLRASPTKRIPWKVFKDAYPIKAAAREACRPDRAHGKHNGPRVPVTDYSIEQLLWERVHPGEKYVHPETSDQMLQTWLVRKGSDHGFVVADLVIRPDPLTGDMQRGSKLNAKGDKIDLSHKAIVFDGVLKVTDLDAFQDALRQGIGSGKAYGFGLLSIRRLRGV